MESVLQQIALEDVGALRLVVVVDVVSLAALVAAILHQYVSSLQRIVSVRHLALGVSAHHDALQSCLSWQAVDHPSRFLADGFFPFLALALHPLFVFAWVLAAHDAGGVFALSVANVLPHLSRGCSACLAGLLASQAVVVSVALAHLLDVLGLSALDASQSFGALR